MENKQAISFEYSNILGVLVIWVALPLAAFVGLVVLCMAIWQLYELSVDSGSFYYDLFTGVALIGVSVWMLASFCHWLRDRHAFVTRYVLDDAGITITPNSESSIRIAWDEFDYSVANFMLRYIHVYSTKLDMPVTLIFGTPGRPATPENYDLAKELVGSKTRMIRRFW